MSLIEPEQEKPDTPLEFAQAVVLVIWAICWLFTVGYAKLGFWAGAWALLVWPYYLGDLLAK